MVEDLGLDPRRFVFRPELSLLYDREHGLEHQLNSTAAKMTAVLVAGVDGLALRALGNELAAPVALVQRDLRQLRDRFVSARTGEHPTRKSGAPAAWADVDVPFPLVLELELTKVCNWHCDFCYNVWKVSDEYGRRSRSEGAGRDSPGHLPVETVDAVLTEASQQGCLRIRLSGGEPTLHPRFDDIISMAGEHGFDTEVFTNGVRLSHDRAKHMADNRVRVLLVSIHGSPATHNRLARNERAYVQALGAIEAGAAAGLRVVAESLICDENAGEIPALATMLHDIGVESLSLMPYVASGPDDPRRGLPPSDIPELIRACQEATDGGLGVRVPCAPKHCLTDEPSPIDEPVMWEFDDHCAAGILWASISWDGRLRHCPHSDAYAGDVGEGIGSVWRDRVVPAVRRALAPSPTCAPCSQFSACQGGCHLGRVHYSRANVGSSSGPVQVAITRKRGELHVVG